MLLPKLFRLVARRPTRPRFARRVGLALALVLAGLAAPAAAQTAAEVAPSDTLREVRLADGSSFYGRVVAVEGERIVFETTAGARIEVMRAQVQSMRPVAGRVVDGVFWRDDPNKTRLLLISPTGRTLPRGEGYFSSFWIFFPFVAYGVTDQVTLAAGTPLIPEVVGRVLYLAPKVRLLRRPGVELAAGTLALFATEALDEGSVGIFYGVGSFGDSDRALTAGAGWAYAWGGTDPWVSNDALLMLGGEYRIGPRTKLLSEIFFVPGESGALLSGGLRFFGERLSADFGLAVLAGFADGDEGVPWLPVLNFVYNFGGRR
jgi:hypothetical protein